MCKSCLTESGAGAALYEAARKYVASYDDLDAACEDRALRLVKATDELWTVIESVFGHQD